MTLIGTSASPAVAPRTVAAVQAPPAVPALARSRQHVRLPQRLRQAPAPDSPSRWRRWHARI